MRVAAVSITLATVCTFSYGVLPSLWMLLAVSLIHAVADSFTLPANQVAAAMAAPLEDASSGQGLLGATGLAAAGITGLVAGYTYQHLGRAALFSGTAAVMVGFLALALASSKEFLRPLPAEARGGERPLICGSPADRLQLSTRWSSRPSAMYSGNAPISSGRPRSECQPSRSRTRGER